MHLPGKPQAPHPDKIRFGDFELDPREEKIRRGALRVRLQPQPFRVLLFLISRAGHLVTRDELREKIWGTQTHVDFEHGLNFCIQQIRSALGDDAHHPRFVETVPRRGYRFVARVIAPAPATGHPLLRGSNSSSSTRSGVGTVLLASVMFFLVALAAFISLYPRVGDERLIAGNEVPRLAVLPFANLDGNPDQNYLGDGLTEETITLLAKELSAEVGIVARTSVMQYRDTTRDVRTIGSELGVHYILEGGVRQEAGRVRITAQLIRVRDQTHLWAESFERDLSGAFALQRDVAHEVTLALAAELQIPHKASRAPSKDSHSPGHDAFLKARYHFHRMRQGGLEKSLEFYQEALVQDPALAKAWAGQAESYNLMAQIGLIESKDGYRRARHSARRALELDPDSPEAYLALALPSLYLDFDWAEAQSLLQRAIDINSGYALAHHWRALLLAGTGHHEESLSAIHAAVDLDPLSPLINADVGWYHFLAGDVAGAIRQCRRTLDLEPGAVSAHSCLRAAYLSQGMESMAIEEAGLELALLGVSEEHRAGALDAYTDEGLNAFWKIRLKQEMEQPSCTVSASRTLAEIHSALGEKGLAMDALEQAFETRAAWLPLVKVDPAFSSLRRHPRFHDLLARLGLQVS